MAEKEVKKKSEKSFSQEEKETFLKEIEKLKEESEENKNKWMRSVAEFDNYKKRNAKMWQEAYNEGVSSIILKILPVGDNLEWALSIGLDEKTEQGIKNIKKKFDETLSGIGIEEINPLGQEFNPLEAEAVMMVDAEEGEQVDTVKQVLQKGYRMKDKIIRYAKVSVIK